jgi:hypothetical protein
VSIFSGEVPFCRIRGYDRFKSRFRLTLRHGGKHEIIAPEWYKSDGDDAQVKIEAPLGQFTTLELEIIGFSSYRPEPSQLSFILLPQNTSISWTRDLLGYDEYPEVSFRCPIDLKLDWEPKAIFEKRNDRIEFRFDPGTEYVVCTSQEYPDFELSLRFHIAQFYPLNPPSPSNRDILWKSTLKEQFKVVVRGFGEVLEVGIMWDKKIRSVWQDDLQRKMKATVYSYEFREGIPEEIIPAGRFLVRNGDNWKPTNCTYIDERGFEKFVLEKDDSLKTYLPEKVSEIFLKAIKIVEGSEPEDSFNGLDEIPVSLKQFLLFLEAGAMVFDKNLNFTGIDEIYKDIPYKKWLLWYDSARLGESSEYDLHRDIPDEDIPPIERWRKKIESILARVRNVADISGMLLRWAKDVEKPFLENKSEISKMAGGPSLSIAAHYYQEKNYKHAIQKLKVLDISGKPVPVDTLAESIRQLSFLHLWRTRQPKIPETQNDQWLKLQFLVAQFIGLFQGQSKIPDFNNEDDYSNMQLLFQILNENLFSNLVEIIKFDKKVQMADLAVNEPLVAYLLKNNSQIQKKLKIPENETEKIYTLHEKNGSIPEHVSIG